MAQLFGTNQISISRTIERVAELLMKEFVPMFLGIDHLTREEIIKNHNRNNYRILFNAGEDELFLLMDGTYVYTEKPANFKLQKALYSMQKLRTLVKPFMIVLPSGYILDAPGPFIANGIFFFTIEFQTKKAKLVVLQYFF